MNTAGFIFCVCPDGRLLRKGVDDMLEERGAGAWRRHMYWGDEELPPAFWDHLSLPGLFAERRALVLRRAHLLPAAVWKRLSAALAVPKPQCLPFFCLEAAWEKGKPKIPQHIAKLKCFVHAEAEGWVRRFPGLDEAALRAFVRKEAEARGVRIDADALKLLCDALIPDAAAVASELDKLSLAAEDGRVSVELASQAVHMPRFNIFRFLRLVRNGDAGGAWLDALRAGREDEGLVFPLIGLMLRDARMLWRFLHDGTDAARPGEDAAGRRTAARLGHKGLARLFGLLFAADLSVKSGERRPEQAFDALVADLTLLFASPRDTRSFGRGS
jgi:DNA polymerase-3 subunit delta